MRKGLLILAPITIFTAALVACGASERRSGFGDNKGDGGFEGGQSFTPGDQPCAGLECKVVSCSGQGEPTSLRGKVYDPAGSNPLYNVQVYIPGGNDPEELPPMKDSTQEPDGIACETCASVVLNPLRSTLTDSKGEFVLENVPVDKDVPVVIQIGKWRRLMHIDITKECDENKVPNRDFRLPRNGDEGNMPQIAVTSGGYDALECLLRGIGIDDSEFVNGHDDSGHVHMFKGDGGGMGTDAQSFWTSGAELRKYDMVLLSCEGSPALENKGGSNAEGRRSMYEYLNAGGKAFATHYHASWFKDSPEPEFQGLANWSGFGGIGTTFDVNQTFPKGERFAEWLDETGASSSPGKISLQSPTNSLSAINDPALAWITAGDGTPKYFSFNTPLSAPVEEQCGRAVFSDVHITEKAGPTSISACGISSGGLNAQQKALEFLFFDLSSCVSDDKKEPTPPK
jgi:hypothetical protein